MILGARNKFNVIIPISRGPIVVPATKLDREQIEAL